VSNQGSVQAPSITTTGKSAAVLKDKRLREMFTTAIPIHNKGERFRAYDGELLWT
jgi:hypothetical protein